MYSRADLELNSIFLKIMYGVINKLRIKAGQNGRRCFYTNYADETPINVILLAELRHAGCQLAKKFNSRKPGSAYNDR